MEALRNSYILLYTTIHARHLKDLQWLIGENLALSSGRMDYQPKYFHIYSNIANFFWLNANEFQTD